MSLKESIVLDKLPKHIAVIMDGNGRWAKQRQKERIFGHQNGVNAVREVTEAVQNWGLNILHCTLFLLKIGIDQKKKLMHLWQCWLIQ